jgi:hypothetical protein
VVSDNCDLGFETKIAELAEVMQGAEEDNQVMLDLLNEYNNKLDKMLSNIKIE